MQCVVCMNFNIQFKRSTTQIVHLGKSNIRLLGNLKVVLIKLSSNPKIHQINNIFVVDIPESYGLLLSRDCQSQLNGYFSTNWSHLWSPFNVQNFKVKIER